MQKLIDVAVKNGFRLKVAFADGASFIIDLNELIRQGGVFEALRDPAVFAAVRLGSDGRFIEWPGQIDLCADALRQQALANGEALLSS